MELTNQQKRRIARFLDEALADVPESDANERRIAAARLKAKIRDRLRQLPGDAATDAELEQVLVECASKNGGVPADRPKPAAPPAADRNWALDVDEAKLLGVCAGVAEHLGLETWVVRAGMLALLLVTGPFALIAYLAGFAALYQGAHPDERPAIDAKAAGWAAAEAAGTTLAIFIGFELLMAVLAHVYTVYLGGSMVALGDRWGWLPAGSYGYFIWALLFSVPVAVLSALPLREAEWSKTIRKVSRALVALYAVYLTYGLACLLTGMLLQLRETMQVEDIQRFIGEYLRF